MGIHEDRKEYEKAVYYSAYSDEVREIASELDRLAGHGRDGSMVRLQVASVLYAATSVGYKLQPPSTDEIEQYRNAAKRHKLRAVPSIPDMDQP